MRTSENLVRRYIRTVRNVVKYAGKAYVGEALVAEAELLCTLRPIE